jgi:ubiquinone/menaquinone biosynthesis C-methylase UbiE
MEHFRFDETDVARYWDSNANLWAEQVNNGWDAYREHFNNPSFLKFIGPLDGEKVLDAGCGEGHNTRILARSGTRMTGIDISPRMVKLAQQVEERESLGIHYEVASYSDLSMFEDCSFDSVVSFVALMDGPDYESAIKEFSRVIKRKGNLFFSITHPCFATKGYGWIRDDNGNPIKYTISDYFSKESWLDHWRFSKGPIAQDTEPFAVPRFPRTLSDYLNNLIKAGFTLAKIEEPRPSEKMCQEYPWLRKWRDHAAIYLYVHAVRA